MRTESPITAEDQWLDYRWQGLTVLPTSGVVQTLDFRALAPWKKSRLSIVLFDEAAGETRATGSILDRMTFDGGPGAGGHTIFAVPVRYTVSFGVCTGDYVSEDAFHLEIMPVG